MTLIPCAISLPMDGGLSIRQLLFFLALDLDCLFPPGMIGLLRHIGELQ